MNLIEQLLRIQMANNDCRDTAANNEPACRTSLSSCRLSLPYRVVSSEEVAMMMMLMTMVTDNVCVCLQLHVEHLSSVIPAIMPFQSQCASILETALLMLHKCSEECRWH